MDTWLPSPPCSPLHRNQPPLLLPRSDGYVAMVLTGHANNAEFAIAMCPSEPYVLSGGKDKLVVLWSIHDHISTLVGDSTNPSGSIVKNSDNASLGPCGIFQGHTDTVEDWCPDKPSVFGSSAEDGCVNIWDYEQYMMQQVMFLLPNASILAANELIEQLRSEQSLQWFLIICCLEVMNSLISLEALQPTGDMSSVR
ncbi:hypothetical protein L2E82_27451 [Cichorium intybus]|uniref:Uncharacterized protein n=1 Tax=Cichorium intybus TaxID=13427 RepID=A0ACB9CTE8_CICIN|nr:hypothetical protein L2E82_27451 [Cichorium intybus]